MSTSTTAECDYVPHNILLTGGCGFIGSHVCKFLVQKYPRYNFVNLDILDDCASVKNVEAIVRFKNYTFVQGCIGNMDLVSHLMSHHKIDTVMHFAAQSHVDTSFGNPLAHTETNVLGTHTLLECSKQYNIRRFVHVSTDEVYGDVFGEGAMENSALEPTNPYACSKAAAEFICKAYMRSYKLPVIITRGNNVYGPNQYPEKVLPKFILRLLLGEKACVHGTGEALRSYVHVDDVVRAFDLILHRGINHQIYNIGTRFEISILEIARQVVRLLGLVSAGEEDRLIEKVADRNINDLRYCVDDRKLAALGWSPQVPWEKGLAETIEWYRNLEPDHWADWTSALRPHPVRPTGRK